MPRNSFSLQLISGSRQSAVEFVFLIWLNRCSYRQAIQIVFNIPNGACSVVPAEFFARREM